MSVPFAGGRPLPTEILENIAFELVASTPLGNPSQLLPLLVTSKAVHNALAMGSGTALYSRICRFKFDVGAVARRSFTPLIKDLDGHLVQMCTLLKFISSGDVFHEDAEDQLVVAYIAMLDNDGKNRAQLEHVGIVEFVDKFVRKRLHEGKEENDGWPRDHSGKVYALWLMWFFSTRDRILAETEEERAEIIRLVFPFLVCPHRYTSAIAPPLHFTLPLGPDNLVQRDIFTVETAHGYYPRYHTNDRPCNVLYHFSSHPIFMEPLIAPAAMLIFWSRREVNGCFQIPPHLPRDRAARQGRPGLTQADLNEFNATKVAKLPPRVVWNWDRGIAVKRAEDGTESEPTDPASNRFDIDWWRARLCTGVLTKQPKFRPGAVWLRGMMDGVWQGIMFGQSHTSFLEILNHRQCSPNLSEGSTCFTSRPVWIRIAEHGFVRTPSCPQSTPVPPAPPGQVDINIMTPGGPEPRIVPMDVSLGNAWLPGPVGSLRWVSGCDPLDAGAKQDKFAQPSKSRAEMDTTKFIVSSQPPFAPQSRDLTSDFGGPISHLVAQCIPGERYVYEHFEKEKESVHERMIRAKENFACVSTSPDGGPPQHHPGCLKCSEKDAFLEARRAKDMQRMAYGPSEDDIEEAFQSVGMGRTKVADFRIPDGILDAGDHRVIDLNPVEAQGDQSSASTSVPIGEAYASQLVPVSSTPPPQDSPGRQVSPTSSMRSTPGPEDDDSDMLDADDEEEEDDPGRGLPPGSYGPSDDGVRRSHDRYRVEECDDGVEDVVLTGDLEERHRLAWGGTVYYGRVRPWDGMVAILSLSRDAQTGFNNHFIYYGYVYGGDVFVGNWRYALMDPLVPSFECGFIMSKKDASSPPQPPVAAMS